MIDIVERLRDPSRGSPRWGDTMAEAADEIERLRAERDEAQAEANAGRQAEHDADVERRAVESERDRLRDARDAAARALHKAGEQFAYYANEHAKKGTPDGDVKAATNQQWAQRCFNAHDAALKEPGHE
jgi:chromosome segregation ATPase